MDEKDLERKLTRGVRAAGGLCVKLACPGYAGMPDRLVILPGGKVYFVELKAANGRLSKIQKAAMSELMRLGANWMGLKGEQDVRLFLKMIGGGGNG